MDNQFSDSLTQQGMEQVEYKQTTVCGQTLNYTIITRVSYNGVFSEIYRCNGFTYDSYSEMLSDVLWGNLDY